MKRSLCFLAALVCLWGSVKYGHAYDINEKFSVGGVAAGAYQYRELSDDMPDFDDAGRGGAAFQPEVSFRPTDKDMFFVKLGFGARNGLKQTDPEQASFALSPWAADLEDDVRNINGRGRDYLLAAWYKHTFRFGDDHSLGIAGGIIDATDYVDENAYANDEFTQFMNEALVNGPNGFAPSYDIGGALEWESGAFSAKGVAMGVGENDDGNTYNYYAAQFGYHPKTGLGEGNYRVIFYATTKDFLDPGQEKKDARKATLLSFDQELGEIFGAWIRFGWGDEGPVLVWKNLYSGGIDIKGDWWNREKDNIGIGYGHLSRGNQDIDITHVFEAYYRFVFNEILSATADVQYMKDDYHEDDDRKGWVLGVRVTAEF
ncbi:MAG: porin [Deltaproteobacteria bacterium HGW-Deltaproteobacteria-15]|nr:MAG: porin [Deltaproteobacteria bacterium HGW-Deltaproteobacteria-15]